ncbi:MAG: hypothetical protein II623_00290 [Paludibacteraceae bacterium]|jgi:chromosome segregation ATPase|nr:hypothetical protein [Paludibacteraceae bacterium]MBR6041173.1 hypothetical protein [Paludibacteraceae bacterium]
MKKKFLLVAAIASVIGFASCNGDQIEAQQRQIDSLTNVNDMLQKQNQSDLETLDQVFQNFAEIKKAQLGLSEEANSTEGVTEDQKQKIQENFKLINDKFAENAQKLDSLQNVLNSTKGKISALRGTIAKLQKMQAQSQQEIATLKKQLEDKDIEIADLKSAHASQVAQMTAKAEADSAANAAKIAAQDKAMHTVSYLIDTEKNLKAKGIKGAAGRLKKGEVKESMCTKVDYREFEGNDGITFKKEPTLFSYHTPGSYTIKKNADKTWTFTITNQSSFWNTKVMILAGERIK